MIVAAVAAVIVAAAAVASYVIWDREFRRASSSNPGFGCPVVVQSNGRAPLTAIGVHRVALIGDSIMDQASCAVAGKLADAGIETFRFAAPGTGLINGALDWVMRTRQIVATTHADVVVAIFVGNYPPPPITQANGSIIADDSPEFFALWQQRAAQLSAVVRAGGARMYWVSPPPIGVPVLAHAQRLYDGYRTIKADHFLDAGRVLGHPSGQFVMTKETCGRPRVVRTNDGVHLTPDGARIYGEEIAHELTSQLGVLASPKPC